MKLARIKLAGGLIAGMVLLLGPWAANATPIGTAANTNITNKATVNYQVGGVSQTLIESAPGAGNSTAGVGNGTDTSFLVDTKLVLTVTKQDSGLVSVSPGQKNVVLVYMVQNKGNSTQGVVLSAINEGSGTADPFGGATNDSFDANAPTTPGTGSPSIFASADDTGGYDSVNDTSSSIFSLASGDSDLVYVVASIPTGQANGDVSVIGLKAQVAATGASYAAGAGAAIATDDSGTAWVAGTLQKIFADAAGTDDAAHDGFASDRDGFKVSSAKLTITKVATVLTDPVGCNTAGQIGLNIVGVGACTGTAANYKSIPGSVMKYTVTVKNDATATANASAISIADDLSAQIGTNLTWFSNGTVDGLFVTAPGVNGGAAFKCADDGTNTTTNSTVTGDHTAVTCDYNKTGAKTVTVSGITLDPGDTATITYEVEIN